MTAVSGRLLVRQVRIEQQAFWRNPDYAFFTFGLPIALLLVLGSVNSKDTLTGSDALALTAFVPGILAFGVIAATYANLAARVATLRNDGVLKRIRTTPLSPVLYLGGHLFSTLLTTLLIAVCTIVLGALVFDVGPPRSGLGELALGLTLGIVCFAALGLAVSAIIPSADAASPITNATYLPLALVSGVFDPTLAVPSWLTRIVELTPVKALAEALQGAYGPSSGALGRDYVVLAVWSLAGLTLATRFFRWQP